MKNSDQLKSLRNNKFTELNALVEVAEAEPVNTRTPRCNGKGN